MSHARNQVIAAVASLLSAAPTNWERVFKQRIYTDRILRTYLMVYFESEQTEALLIHPANMYRRTMVLRIDAPIRIADYEVLEDTIGAVAEEIETTLTNSALLAVEPNIKDVYLTQTSVLLDEEQQTTFAMLSTTWLVSYVTAEGEPSVLI